MFSASMAIVQWSVGENPPGIFLRVKIIPRGDEFILDLDPRVRCVLGQFAEGLWAVDHPRRLDGGNGFGGSQPRQSVWQAAYDLFACLRQRPRFRHILGRDKALNASIYWPAEFARDPPAVSRHAVMSRRSRCR